MYMYVSAHLVGQRPHPVPVEVVYLVDLVSVASVANPVQRELTPMYLVLQPLVLLQQVLQVIFITFLLHSNIMIMSTSMWQQPNHIQNQKEILKLTYGLVQHYWVERENKIFLASDSEVARNMVFPNIVRLIF